MERYIKEIVSFICDADEGLELFKDSTLLIISTNNIFANAFNDKCEHIYSCSPGNFLNEAGKITDHSIDYIIIDSSFNNFDPESLRKKLRTKLNNSYSDTIIVEGEIPINPEKIEIFFAGSWYEKKEFSDEDNAKLTLYYNPPGFNSEEMKSKEITEFVNTCEDYCNVIENYKNYSVKGFLYNVQKCLVNYYSKGFDLPDCCGSDGDSKISDQYSQKEVSEFFKMSNELLEFLGEHNVYWSNFSPYPIDDDKETYDHSLANDLAEIYEDIKGSFDGFTKGNIFDKQEMLWQFKFDWEGHTGDHWTFAVRAIHWKLQDLEYDE